MFKLLIYLNLYPQQKIDYLLDYPQRCLSRRRFRNIGLKADFLAVTSQRIPLILPRRRLRLSLVRVAPALDARDSKMKNALAVLGIAALAAGRATPSTVTPYGKDSYIIAVDDGWGVYSSSSLQVKAAQEANAFCAKQGKVLRVRNASERGTAGWTGTSSSLVFSCISEADPENTRPDLRR